MMLQMSLPNNASDDSILHNVDHEKESEERDLRAIRVTSTGALYVSPGNIGTNDTILRLAGDNGHRKEKVIGHDTREIITDTATMPFKAIGEIDYSRFSEGGCTGSIIGASSVLTAGHCVYNQKDQRWQSPYSFSPGRYRSNDQTIEPFGVWLVDYTTTYLKYTQTGDVEYDLAIMTMKSNANGKVGDYMGQFWIGVSQCAFPGDSGISGYPGDKSDGTLWKSQPCDRWYHDCRSKSVFHQCDTYGGFSGAPIYTKTNVVIGVHTHAYGPQIKWNGGVAFDNVHVNSLKSWMSDSSTS